MPAVNLRGQRRKTTKGSFSAEVMTNAVDSVRAGMSIRKVARTTGLAFQTLARYVQKRASDENARMSPNYAVRQVFTSEQESTLAMYLLDCSKMFYGLSTRDCRQLAYEMAEKNDIIMPRSWKIDRCAGLQWFRSFMIRHRSLSIRTPEGCSLSRATSFNKHNVEMFYGNLETAMRRSPLFADGTRIYNLDETATTTVQKPKRIIAGKGTKQVGQATSAERGTLVTTCCIISASGNSLPPAMVFPRVNFRDYMIRGAPPGTLGLAAKSGWMTVELFEKVMEHFIKYSGSTTQNPTLLIFDNHESHLSYKTLDLAKSNGVTVLTIPPHCSHRLQPLDVSVYYPFSKYYDDAINSWMLSNPGKPITIYEIASCVNTAHQRALTPANIISGFRKTGIYPFDRHLFSDDDFMSSAVSDRPNPENQSTTVRDAADISGSSENRGVGVLQSLEPDNLSRVEISRGIGVLMSPEPAESLQEIIVGRKELQNSASTSGCVEMSEPDIAPGPSRVVNVNELKFLSPQKFRGFPQAKPRKAGRKGREKGRSIIATDTPEKQRLEMKQISRKIKACTLGRGIKKQKLAFEIEDDLEDDSDEDLQATKNNVIDSDDSNMDISENEEDALPVVLGDLARAPQKDDYVLVQFSGRRKLYYCGLVTDIDDDAEYEVRFYRKDGKVFVEPDVEDISAVIESDIVMLLPSPKVQGHTKRQKARLNFQVNFEELDVR